MAAKAGDVLLGVDEAAAGAAGGSHGGDGSGSGGGARGDGGEHVVDDDLFRDRRGGCGALGGGGGGGGREGRDLEEPPCVECVEASFAKYCLSFIHDLLRPVTLRGERPGAR